MQLYQKMVLTTTLLLAASISIAQEPYRSPDSDLMARLFYDNSGPVQPGNVHHVCIAVSRDGEYRIVRSFDDGHTQRLHGKMPKEEFGQLSKLLRAPEFRNLSGSHAGMVRQEAETFLAEIPLADQSHVDGAREWPEHDAWRLQWLNGDGENPFPASVSKLVDWLQGFQPKDGQTFESSEYPDVCPRVGLRFLQPSVAENSHP
jgi:hypothetical protein